MVSAPAIVLDRAGVCLSDFGEPLQFVKVESHGRDPTNGVTSAVSPWRRAAYHSNHAAGYALSLATHRIAMPLKYARFFIPPPRATRSWLETVAQILAP